VCVHACVHVCVCARACSCVWGCGWVGGWEGGGVHRHWCLQWGRYNLRLQKCSRKNGATMTCSSSSANTHPTSPYPNPSPLSDSENKLLKKCPR
jgi:hypothetical protein